MSILSRSGPRAFLGLLLASGFASGCATVAASEPGLPSGAVPLAAPAVYREWHRKTEGCSGLRGSFAALEWYVVPGVSTFSTTRGPQVGMWSTHQGSSRIILAGNYLDHEMVIRHEILHALIGRAGHPEEYFVARCRLTWDSWDRTIAESTPWDQ